MSTFWECPKCFCLYTPDSEGHNCPNNFEAIPSHCCQDCGLLKSPYLLKSSGGVKDAFGNPVKIVVCRWCNQPLQLKDVDSDNHIFRVCKNRPVSSLSDFKRNKCICYEIALAGPWTYGKAAHQ